MSCKRSGIDRCRGATLSVDLLPVSCIYGLFGAQDIDWAVRQFRLNTQENRSVIPILEVFFNFVNKPNTRVGTTRKLLPMPVGPVGRGRVVYSTVLMISAQEQHREEAIPLIRFLLCPRSLVKSSVLDGARANGRARETDLYRRKECEEGLEKGNKGGSPCLGRLSTTPSGQALDVLDNGRQQCLVVHC